MNRKEILELDARISAEMSPDELKPRRRRKHGFVYLIAGEHGGPVKIGWATDPAKRLDELQPANPTKLVVLQVFPGTEALERKFHKRYAEHRIRGEWFDLPPDVVRSLINSPPDD